MKRFIDLSDQIIEGEFKFAWFDTVTASFETHAGAQTWRTWTEFEADYEGEDLARYSALFPDYLPHPCPRC